MTKAEFYESYAITYDEWEASLNQAQEEYEAESWLNTSRYISTPEQGRLEKKSNVLIAVYMHTFTTSHGVVWRAKDATPW